jgi:DNA-binding transcriptional MerR regulator
MEQLSIGEFARRSRLSPKALRLYDEMGLLLPARVDATSGYRYYEVRQLERARLVSALRQLEVPLVEIRDIIDFDPETAAERIAEYWASAETAHAARRDLAGFVVDQLRGRKSTMYEVQTRDIPRRSLLCLKRHVDGEAGAWALGKEFVGLLKEHPAPRMEGRAGAAFCIYWGEVNDDSDGPLEWCRPVPEERVESLAADFPGLSFRSEPAHEEAFVNLGPGGQTSASQWQLVSESLHAWATARGAQPSELGVRITYLATPPRTESSVPDCDIAVPFRWFEPGAQGSAGRAR